MLLKSVNTSDGSIHESQLQSSYVSRCCGRAMCSKIPQFIPFGNAGNYRFLSSPGLVCSPSLQFYSDPSLILPEWVPSKKP